MIRLLFIPLLVVAAWSFALAEVPDTPDHSLLWNSFTAVEAVDSFLLATTDNGLIVLERNDGTDLYGERAHLWLPSAPYRLKVIDSIAVIQSEVDMLYFVDLRDLPQLTLLGQADLPEAYWDFAVVDSNLYVAAGFGGMRLYTLTDFNNPQFADSSLTGIHVIQVEIQGDELFALDDYNGLLRYDISTNGLDAFVDYMYIPARVSSFAQRDSTVSFTLADYRMLLVGWYDATGPMLGEPIALAGHPNQTYISDNFIVALDVDYATLEMIDRSDNSVFRTWIPWDYETWADGAVVMAGGKDQLFLPTLSGGIDQFTLNDLWFDITPKPIYDRAGPITTVLFENDRLFTGGQANPLEVFAFDTSGRPFLDTIMYGHHTVGPTDHDDSLFVVSFPVTGYLYMLRFANDSISLVGLIDVSDRFVKQVDMFRNGIDSVSSVLVTSASTVDFHRVFSDYQTELLGTASVVGVIHDVATKGGILCVTTNKSLTYGYTLFGPYMLEPLWTVQSPTQIVHLQATGPRDYGVGQNWGELLLAFSQDSLYFIKQGETRHVPWQYHSISALTLPVTNSCIAGSLLYTIGPEGVTVFDLNSDTPVAIEFGGRPGSLIAADTDRIATSDGKAIHLYAIQPEARLDEPTVIALVNSSGQLGQNFPNPFNPTTTIAYELSTTTAVKIVVCNLLGQRVITLIDGVQPIGRHQVTWDGRDELGQQVATGVYFYRLILPEHEESRKMLFLK